MQPTASLFARAVRKLKLTTKMTGKGYYKGTRSGNTGHFSYNPKRYFMYQIEPEKVRTFVVPPFISESQLTPFVARRVKVPKKSPMKVSGRGMIARVKDVGHDLS